MSEDDRKPVRNAEVAETEALLAGFDRPGRTPRSPPVKRDFIAHHEGDRSEPQRPPRATPPKPAETFVIARKKPLPRWLPIAIGLALMPIFGGLLVFALVRPEPPASQPIAPSSATTTSMASVPVVVSAPPPEEPPAPSVTASEAPAVRPTPSSPKPSPSSDPRGDFMRKL